jgi:hypothetical protein
LDGEPPIRFSGKRGEAVMAKIFGILVIVVAVWVGLTIFNEGTDAAFGGLFASKTQLGQTQLDPAGRPLPRRVEQSVSKAYQEHEKQMAERAED